MKHKFCIKGKKSGIVGSAISNFWSYVLFVFVVIIFFVFFHIQGEHAKGNFIGSLEGETNMDAMGLNYLRTPYTLDGSIIPIADMIVRYNNEKDSTKKKSYYEQILKKTKEILNPFEHCIIPEGISDKLVVGYAAYILDKESYEDQKKLIKNYAGTAVKTDLKFRSDHFFDGRITKQFLTIIPNAIPQEVVYIGFFSSSVNVFGRDTENVRDCK